MSKEFFDFDKLFEDFIRAKFLTNKNIKPELIRAQLGRLYHEWSETRLDILGDVAPVHYYKGIKEVNVLIEFLIKSCENGRRPNGFLLDRICELPAAVPLIRTLISENRNSILTLTSIELLQIMNAAEPLEDYVELLKENYDDIELREAIIETLAANADKVKESLCALIPYAEIDLKTIIAEILINAQKDERTYALLTELFIEMDNIPLIASYIGKYGDERLITLLYKAIDTCNYMEYIEIKNAIERMGGIVDDDHDFSDDIYYKIIKDGYKT